MTGPVHGRHVVDELRELSASLAREAQDAAVREGADIKEPDAVVREALDLIEADLVGVRNETGLDIGATSTAKRAHPLRAPRGRSAAIALLVDRAAAGDDRAWTELVDEFSALVWRIARSYRLSREDAAEVSQATWMRLVQHIDDVRQPSNIGAWLATTARRESLRLLRMRGVVPGYAEPELANPQPDPGAQVAGAERRRNVEDALARFPERQRRLLLLLAADPTPSYREVSAALEIPIGSIGPLRTRALARLRREAALQGLDKAEDLHSSLRGDPQPLVQIDVSQGTVKVHVGGLARLKPFHAS